MSTTFEEMQARLMEALGEPCDDWFERIIHILEADARRRRAKKIWDVSTVGLRIKCAREALGMSQRQLALRMGVNTGRVSEWESGRRDVPAPRVKVLCLHLKVTVDWLSMLSSEGGPQVHQEVVAKEHSKRWLEWERERKRWRAAEEEARRRNAARKARQEQQERDTPGATRT